METAQKAERNVKNSSRPRCIALNNNRFQVSGHFYIILPLPLSMTGDVKVTAAIPATHLVASLFIFTNHSVGG
jgi:hypothetical protein